MTPGFRCESACAWIGLTGKPGQATPYFDLAERLDTNNYYIALEDGRHFVALGDYAKARVWMERSLNMHWTDEGQVTWLLLLSNIADPLFQQRK